MGKRKASLGKLLIRSLEDAIAYERGELRARTRVLELTAREAEVDAPPRYSGDRVRAIRHQLGLSQQVFARALNVSAQTVRAWEQGTRIPDGASRRLLEIAADCPDALLRKVHRNADRHEALAAPPAP